MAKRRQKAADEEIEIRLNHVYKSVKNPNKTIIVKKVFLEYEEIYECDVNIYDVNGWQIKFYTNEPFTLCEICNEIGIEYKKGIKVI